MVPSRPTRLRTLAPTLVLGGAIALGTVSCGTTEQASRLTLAPMITTTSTTVVATTDPTEGKRIFYEIKPGDGLQRIAESFDVPPQAIIDLNEGIITDPNNIPAGVTIEIPNGVVFVDELPSDETTTT